MKQNTEGKGEKRSREALVNSDSPASLGDSLVGPQVLLKFLCSLTPEVILFLILFCLLGPPIN